MAVMMLQDAASFCRAQKYTKDVLSEPWNLNIEYLAARDWRAVLLPGCVSAQENDQANPALLAAMAELEPNGYFGFHTEGLMLTEDLSDSGSLFASHSVSANISEAFTSAIGTNNIEDVDWEMFDWSRKSEYGLMEWCFDVGPAKQDLYDFWRDHLSLYNLLVPRSEAFLIMNVGYDFHIIAGPSTFVESALGESIDSAQARVRTGDYWHQGDRECFLGYASRYETLDCR